MPGFRLGGIGVSNGEQKLRAKRKGGRSERKSEKRERLAMKMEKCDAVPLMRLFKVVQNAGEGRWIEANMVGWQGLIVQQPASSIVDLIPQRIQRFAATMDCSLFTDLSDTNSRVHSSVALSILAECGVIFAFRKA